MNHLAMLAETINVQMVNPYILWDSLDCSTDLEGPNDFDIEFASLLSRKFFACSPWFRENLRQIGIQEPIVIIIRSDGEWQMDEGHHRLADALFGYYDVPVVFDDSGSDDESLMCFQVSREDVEAYHDTTEADLIPLPRPSLN